MKKRIAIHIGQDGAQHIFVEADADVQVLFIDERAPHDRVYEMTKRHEASVFEALIGDDPIGSRFDARHKAVEARVLAHMDGKRYHLTVVLNDEDQP